MHSYLKSTSTHGNVVFNFRGDPIGDLSAYASGYHRAASALVDRIDQVTGYPDYDGYPILFLYRHALELYLKTVVYKGAKLLEVIDEEAPDLDSLFCDHRLARLLPAFKQILEGVEWPWDSDVDGAKTFEDFRELVNSIESIDPRSYSFRYPIDTRQNASLPQHHVINVIQFGRSMDRVLELIDGAVTGLSETWDATAEAIHEIRRVFKEDTDATVST